ncbi:MAG: hypothetical protein ACRECX_14950 [Methyloceanibacter sp.]|uniref:hypothetical protein n=1 Tax=Methyloceanibacter sp. TaxID=1965321 RepID=UPI003D6C8970
MRSCVAILAIILVAAAPVAAAACTGTNIKTKQRQTVQEIYRTGVSHPRRFIAEATHDPKTGRPVIIYYSRYASAPGYFKSFVRAHECCHHAGNRNEIAANCCALRRLRLSASGLAAIRNYIISKDINSQTVVDYQGQGGLFWSKTESQCLGSAKL